MIELVQDRKGHHSGRRPHDSREVDPAQRERLRLQQELRDAVEAEDYERAAALRDQLKETKTA